MIAWKKRPALTLIITLGLSGMSCVAPFSKGVRERINKDLSFREMAADPDRYRGQIVIVGGEIIETVPRNDFTEVTVLQQPLSFDYSPMGMGDDSAGRFILRVQGFLDPVVYSEGRKVTSAAEVDGIETRMIGEKTYAYPVLVSLEIKLWPLPPDPAFVREDPLEKLFWGPHGEPYWGPPHP